MLEQQRLVTISEAQIKTLSVEVKALTINGKQMTMSIFRQLQKESIIDSETLTLRGTPWGKVHYFWGDCRPDHLHVVWQLGHSLRRDCVYPTWPSLQETIHRVEYLRGDLWSAAYALSCLSAYKTTDPIPVEQTSDRHIFGSRVWTLQYTDKKLEDVKEYYAFLAKPELPSYRQVTHEKNPQTGKYYERALTPEELTKAMAERKEELRAKIKSELYGLLRHIDEPSTRGTYDYNWNMPRDMTEESLRAHIAPDIEEYFWQAKRLQWMPNTWKERYRELDALDQLFIAA